ncbi:MAG: WXG100 family type VII secretion target [Lachnospiraceae bacterium]|nr:WXG100 family type VII secretion target [Lachnospiraceae bacterium]
MAEGIQISTQVLTDTAQKLRNINMELSDKLEQINIAMNSLENTWRSDAATDIRSAMNALRPTFERYEEIVESYARFLVNTAESYEATESAIQNNAQQFS